MAPRPADPLFAARSANAGILAFGLALGLTLASFYHDRGQSFFPIIVRFLDSDDALRLAQVRSLLAGGGWFDPVIASIGDGGLHSHWSRLLDLPIAAIILAAGLFVEPARAEQIALLLWPKLVLLGFMTVLLRQVIRETSFEAAAALTGLLWLSLFALVQFQLTRIDHHNVQNACAAIAIVLATSPLATGRSAFAAGLVAGLGLVIGYEALPVIGLLGVLLVGFSLLDDRRRPLAEGFAMGLALALAAGLFATIRPSDWLPAPCDALGVNVVAGAVVAAAGLVGAGRLRGGPALRLAALGGVGLAAAALFLLIEPACIAGPFAKVDPSQGPLWLNHVTEARSLVRFGETNTAIAIAAGFSMLVCLGAQAAAAWRSRGAEEIMRLTLLVCLTALAFRYVKMIPYAQLLGFYCLARGAFTLPMPIPSLTPRAVAMLAILFATPAPAMVGLAAILPEKEADSPPKGEACVSTQDFGALATLPPARILPQPDLGGSLSLFGQHQTMIGNYHRLDREIMRAAAIFKAPAADARRLLDDWRIDIVVHCAGKRLYASRSNEGSFGLAVESGQGLPDWLVPLDLGVASDIRAWRVARP